MAEGYSIWLVEYGYCATQPVSSLMYSRHNEGVRTIPFTFLILKGHGRTIAIDTGYIDEGHAHELHVRFGMTAIRPIEKALADIGVRGEEVDTVILTHAHYDHLGGSTVFPNAHFYLQKKELLDWMETLARPKEYAFLTAALDPNDIRNVVDLADAGRLTLLDGAAENLLPGISCVPVFNSHTYGHQVVTIDKAGAGAGGRWVFTGDACYSFENYGADGKGPYLPVGFGVGSITGMVEALSTIRSLADGDLRRLIITHDNDMWTLHPSVVKSDGMRIAEVQLAAGEQSRLTK
jgi:glyoxylase-like metal-dependent hydrolase (beta-lactamase superfamily II)